MAHCAVIFAIAQLSCSVFRWKCCSRAAISYCLAEQVADYITEWVRRTRNVAVRLTTAALTTDCIHWMHCRPLLTVCCYQLTKPELGWIFVRWLQSLLTAGCSQLRNILIYKAVADIAVFEVESRLYGRPNPALLHNKPCMQWKLNLDIWRGCFCSLS